MDKLKMHSPDLSQDNIAKIRELFPGCVTEALDEATGAVRLAVDFDQLRQELSDHIVDGPQERYRLDWPGKREALALANDTPYGLASTVWTTDLKRAHRVAAGIESGIVWVNTWLLRDLRTPFGGVKASGLGREGGFEAFEFFTEPQNICIKL